MATVVVYSQSPRFKRNFFKCNNITQNLMENNNQAIAEYLINRRSELEGTYLSEDVPIWPLQVAGSRVDEYLYRSKDDESFKLNSERASKALDQADDYASHYMANQREKHVQVIRTMKEELEKDIPSHYLLEEIAEELT